MMQGRGRSWCHKKATSWRLFIIMLREPLLQFSVDFWGKALLKSLPSEKYRSISRSSNAFRKDVPNQRHGEYEKRPLCLESKDKEKRTDRFTFLYLVIVCPLSFFKAPVFWHISLSGQLTMLDDRFGPHSWCLMIRKFLDIPKVCSQLFRQVFPDNTMTGHSSVQVLRL